MGRPNFFSGKNVQIGNDKKTVIQIESAVSTALKSIGFQPYVPDTVVP